MLVLACAGQALSSCSREAHARLAGTQSLGASDTDPGLGQGTVQGYKPSSPQDPTLEIQLVLVLCRESGGRKVCSG